MTVQSDASTCQNFMIYFGVPEQTLDYTDTNYQLECELYELCMSKSDFFSPVCSDQTNISHTNFLSMCKNG